MMLHSVYSFMINLTKHFLFHICRQMCRLKHHSQSVRPGEKQVSNMREYVNDILCSCKLSAYTWSLIYLIPHSTFFATGGSTVSTRCVTTLTWALEQH